MPNFWRTDIPCRNFLKLFPWWHVGSWPKMLLFRTTIFKIPQLNWYYWIPTDILLSLKRLLDFIALNLGSGTSAVDENSIFHHLGCKGLITFSDYIFLLTILSTSKWVIFAMIYNYNTKPFMKNDGFTLHAGPFFSLVHCTGPSRSVQCIYYLK